MSFDRNPTQSIPTQNTNDKNSTSNITTSGRLAKSIPEPYVIPIAGGAAGAVSGFVSCPLDVIKTKLQAQGGFKTTTDGLHAASAAYRGVSGTAATIWKEEGIRGMYRGLGPMLLGYIPTWAVYLTVYNKSQSFFRTKTDNFFLANVYASLAGGACSTMATNPIWVIKTRLMSQSSSRMGTSHARPPWQYKSTWDAAKVMYRREGFMSFYSGLTPALLGLTHVAIQFPLYEVFKERFTGLGKGIKESEEDRAHHFYGLAAAVFFSKVCASTATYPHEVVRTRLQTQQRSNGSSTLASSPPQHSMLGDQGRASTITAPLANGLRYKGTWQTCKAIFMEEGWKGFYAGLGTNLIRAVPSAMTTILTFEYLKKTLFQLQRQGIPDESISGPSLS